MQELLEQDQAKRPDDERHRLSYRKTVALALVGASAAAITIPVLAHQVPGLFGALLVAASASLMTLSLVAAAGGFIVLLRHRRETEGKPDLFALAFARKPPNYSTGWRRWVRPLLGSSLRRGDVVMVLSPDEIHRSLTDGRLNGLPFMPEMLSYCGRSFVVDRRIDKINDWPGGNELRRVQDVVTLLELRCDGSLHAGCEAGCQILWHRHWLRREPGALHPRRAPRAKLEADGTTGAPRFMEELMARASTQLNRGDSHVTRYMCQNTELPKASLPMSKWDIRQDLRPLFNGNLGVTGWLVAVLTWVFNRVQTLRGGALYPVAAPQLPALPTPTLDLRLEPGERVRVRNKYEIGLTLHRYFNRGMWFGEETLRHCNQEFTVTKRVTRLIEERSGEIRSMKTPAIILDKATATGEFLRFCPQNEHVFWREIWLQRVEVDPPVA